MDIFKILTPLTYWISAIIWTYIFIFYIRKLYFHKAVDTFLRILLIILAIDALRTLLESFYFGAWFTSLSGLLPIYIYDYLSQPQIVFIPKLLNLITSILVFTIIIRKWLPMETSRIDAFNALVAEKTKRLKESNEKYKSEAKSSKEIAEYYRQVTINSPLPIMIHAEDGEVMLISNSWTEISGYTLSEINTVAKWTEKAYGKKAEITKERIDILYKAKSSINEGEYTITTKAGKIVIWDFSSAPLEKLADGRRMVISTAVDVTYKNKVEEQNRNSEIKYVNLIKALPLPLMLVNKKGDILYINDYFIEKFGYNITEMPTVYKWFNLAYPDLNYRTPIIDNWNKSIENANQNMSFVKSGEYDIRCKSGEIKKIIISRDITDDGIVATFNDITEQKLAETEVKKLNDNLEKSVIGRTKELDGKAVRLERSQRALTFLLEDVNDIKKQLKVSNIKLVDANKELEAFSYSVSHDLKAPLRAVIGFSQILKEDFAPHLDDESKRYIGLIISNAENMGTLINDLLNFSRMARTKLQKTKVDLSTIAQRVKRELVADNNDQVLNINILDIPMVNADENLIYHVISNLMSNAVKFSSKNENSKVEFGCINKENENVFYVKDNGVGFNMKYAGRIFDVFQRLHTAEEFSGTGIGLSIVQRIVHKHEGRIWVESKLNAGTTFFFTL